MGMHTYIENSPEDCPDLVIHRSRRGTTEQPILTYAFQEEPEGVTLSSPDADLMPRTDISIVDMGDGLTTENLEANLIASRQTGPESGFGSEHAEMKFEKEPEIEPPSRSLVGAMPQATGEERIAPTAIGTSHQNDIQVLEGFHATYQPNGGAGPSSHSIEVLDEDLSDEDNFDVLAFCNRSIHPPAVLAGRFPNFEVTQSIIWN